MNIKTSTLSTAPKRPKWVYSTKRKTLYFVEIQRKTKEERFKPLFFVVPPENEFHF
jgi:hypothetical protein